VGVDKGSTPIIHIRDHFKSSEDLKWYCPLPHCSDITKGEEISCSPSARVVFRQDGMVLFQFDGRDRGKGVFSVKTLTCCGKWERSFILVEQKTRFFL